MNTKMRKIKVAYLPGVESLNILTKVIDGVEYQVAEGGVLVPTHYLRTKTKIRTPKDVVPLLSEERVAETERVVVFTLDGNNQIIRKILSTTGLANQSQLHPRETFRAAIQDGACAICLAHNHPSGNLEPSEADLVATRRIVDCGKTIGIGLLDHLIVSPGGYLSIRERFPAYFT